MVTSRTNLSLHSPLQSLKALEERREVKLKTNFSNVTGTSIKYFKLPGPAFASDHWQRPPDLADLELLSIYSIL